MNPLATPTDGVVVVDKPTGWTSHDVVNKLRGIFGTRRVGHLGTLDPLATGVLPVMIGQATRLARFWSDGTKEYEAVVRFGFATTTWDRDGERIGECVPVDLNAAAIDPLLAPMRGEIDQVPPQVSAKKIGGVPAYKLARESVVVEMQPVRVRIDELEVVSVEGERARLRVRCSAGTYVRAIAQQLGQALGCGAHVDELVRTASGPFRIDQAFTIERLQEIKGEAVLPAYELLPEFPAVFVDDLTVLQIRQGRDFHVPPFRVHAGNEHVKAVGPEGKLIAIGRIVLPAVYHPVVVFN